jgi:hypothetical protein
MDDLVGVFDLDTTTVSKVTRDSLAAAERRGEVCSVGGELPKSFLLVQSVRPVSLIQSARKAAPPRIYLSSVNVPTLIRRCRMVVG